MNDKIERSSVPDYLLYGFAIASIGGPLALVIIYFFTSAYSAGSYSLYATLLGIIVFVAPLLVWYNYSKKIASSGGLYTFVQKSIGEKPAKLQGWLWLISYFLYLPYTVIYVTYYLLPFLFQNLTPYLNIIAFLLSIIIVLPLMFSFKKLLYFILVTAVMQLVIIAIFAYAIFSGSFIHSLGSGGGIGPFKFLGGTFATSLLFICSSLVLFLGGEAKGGTKGIRKALLLSFVVVALFLVVGSIALINTNAQQAGSEMPGFLFISNSLGKNFAYLVAIFAIVSIVDLIFIEFIAITRLSYSMLDIKLSKSIPVISVIFIAASIAGTTNPSIFYNYALDVSLITLYVSFLIVFVAYPFFEKKEKRLSPAKVFIAIVSSLLMLYGLYTILITI